MHILELPTLLRDELFTSAWGIIKPRLVITGYAKPVISYNADGTANYGTSYVPVTWDLSNRINVKKSISLDFNKPFLPLDGMENIIKAGRVQVELINTDESFATEQLGGILKGQGIEQATASLTVDVNGQIFPVYKGKIFGRPDEKFGTSTIEIRDEFWQVVKKPVTFERFSNSQATRASGGTLTATPAIVGTSKYYDGISVWGQNAVIFTSVSNDSQDVIQILRIDVQNGAKLGKYEIEFTGSTTFKVTYPDNLIYTGSIGGLFQTDELFIAPTYWNWISDATGKKIEFFVYKTMSGNPIDLILNELEKSYTQLFGTLPVRPAILPIDFASFDNARARYNFHQVYVSETNKDNSVWANLPGKKPLNVLQLCQKIADHIQCQIVIDNYGFISLRQPSRQGDTMYTLSDSDAIISHEIIGGRADNYFKFQYGYNDGNQSYSAFIIKDERNDPQEEKSIKIITFPYYKQGASDVAVSSVSESFMKRILRSFSILTIKVKPNYALTIRPGDRFRIVTNTQPRIASIWEVYDSNVGIGEEGVFKLIKIPIAPKDPPQFCKARFCQDKYCGE